MERRMGRMIRNMSLNRMGYFSDSGGWEPAVDVLESEDTLYIYMDASGVEIEELHITAEKNRLTISGRRRFPGRNLSCIHQLEIDYGSFCRRINLPVAVNVDRTTSRCRNGFLIIELPKLQPHGKFNIPLS